MPIYIHASLLPFAASSSPEHPVCFRASDVGKVGDAARGRAQSETARRSGVPAASPYWQVELMSGSVPNFCSAAGVRIAIRERRRIGDECLPIIVPSNMVGGKTHQEICFEKKL